MLKRLLYRNFRQIYKVNRWIQHRFTPMGGLILGGMITSGIFGIDTRQSLSFQVFALTSALVFLALIHLLTFRGKFSFRRVLPEFATVGQPVKYKFVVRNLESRLQKELVLYDELKVIIPSLDEFRTSHDPNDKSRNWFDRVVGYPRLMGLIHRKRGAIVEPVTIGDLQDREENELMLELMPYRRGYIHFDCSRVGREDPLGLMRAFKSGKNEDSLLVLPKTYSVPPVNLRGKRKYQQGGMTLASTVGDSQEFMSLRDYKPGDPLRAIHWRSYAKIGHPVVKEFQDEFFVRQGLLLDTFIENKQEKVFEEAVSLASSFIVSEQQQDSLLDLMFVGTESYRFTTGRGLGQVENMLEILACVEPCHDPKFDILQKLILQHTVETSGLICILLDWDEKRQALLKKVISLDIPVKVFVVMDNVDAKDLDKEILGHHAENFHLLATSDMQSQLDELKFV